MSDTLHTDDETDAKPEPTEAEAPVVEIEAVPDVASGDGAGEDKPKRRTKREPREEQCPDLPLAGRVEAVLVASDRPLAEARMLDILGLEPERKPELIAAIEEINAAYDETRRAMRIERVAGGWQVLTRAEYGPLLARTQRDRQQTRLSQAALETLAIIAYRQPVLRAEIEAIRGVSCGEVLRSLLERRMVKITGRSEELGRPMLYGTTREFLKVFGLASTDDLPEVE